MAGFPRPRGALLSLHALRTARVRPHFALVHGRAGTVGRLCLTAELFFESTPRLLLGPCAATRLATVGGRDFARLGPSPSSGFVPVSLFVRRRTRPATRRGASGFSLFPSTGTRRPPIFLLNRVFARTLATPAAGIEKRRIVDVGLGEIVFGKVRQQRRILAAARSARCAGCRTRRVSACVVERKDMSLLRHEGPPLSCWIE